MTYRLNQRVIISCYVLFFVFAWYSQANGRYSMGSKEAFYFMNNSAGGYNSIFAYAVFYLIPFLLFVNMIFPRSSLQEIYRKKNRETIYSEKSRIFLISSVIFCSLLTIVSICLFSIHFGFRFLIEEKFMELSFINGMCLTLFYFFIGMIYTFFDIVTRSDKAALVATFLLVTGGFFLFKLGFQTMLWSPYAEISLFNRYYYGTETIANFVISFFRMAGLSLGAYLLVSVLFKRKDFL